MATQALSLGQRQMPLILRGLAMRLLGLALLAAGLFASIALWGFAPADPSWSQSTGAPVTNPAGVGGAVIADVLLQVIGLAAWLPTMTLCTWGLRLLLNRPLAWPWLPVVALPLALIAAAAALATISPLPARDLWPYRVGLGGFVGDFLFGSLGRGQAGAGFLLVSIGSTLVLGAVALGLRWAESIAALLHLGRISGQIGRWLARHGAMAGSSTAVHLTAVARSYGPKLGGFVRLGAARPAELRGGVGSWLGRGLQLLPPRAVTHDPTSSAAEAPARSPRRSAPTAPRPATYREAELDTGSPEPPFALAENDEARPPAGGDRAGRQALQPPPQRSDRDEPGRTLLTRRADPGGFALPDLDFLMVPRPATHHAFNKAALAETARQLESVLDDFGVKGEIIDVKPGPVVTLYELEPAPGTRSQRVIGLADDIARSLCALSVRVATVPGRNVIGIELPNSSRQTVFLRDLLESSLWTRSEARLALALGKDIAGNSVTVDLARMPHLLIAGTTGSGKSVAINAMILSLLYRLTPAQCRIIMIDPKVIELSVYEDIPHLLAPVVTEPHKAVVALKWVVRQMDERYRLMSHLGVRDIFAFNRRIEQAKSRAEQVMRKVRTGFDPASGMPIIEEQPIPMEQLPLIVVIVDEVADLMLTAGKEIENAIQRLSQKARAAGIHLIVATQRPSVDVITGVIKANLPSRISFRVSSKIDSRTILGDTGAEQLLGQGDMLYLMPGDRIVRVHGALVTDGEVEAVVAHLKAQGSPDYLEDVTSDIGAEGAAIGTADPAGDLLGEAGGDALYRQACQVVARDGKASTSYLQRKLAIGYNSAAKLIERMEQDGLITTADHVGRRQVLMGRGGVDGDELTGVEG